MRAAFLSSCAACAALAACGGKSPPPSGPATGSAPEVDDVVTDEEADPANLEAARERAAPVDTSILTAGHRDARYQFRVPEGMKRLRGVTVQPGDDPRQLSDQGPDGVGLPSPHAMSFDSIVVFSDPSGLGVDASSNADLGAIVNQYGDWLRIRVPSATPATLSTVGPHQVIRVEFPRVEMPDRPVRAGRHYLVLDGTVTVSVDCLWTKPNAEQMAKACDAVAASLTRAR